MIQDRVDRFLDQVVSLRTDLDASAMAAVYRICRLADLTKQRERETFNRETVPPPEFEVLVLILLNEKEEKLTPTRLSDLALSAPSSMSARLRWLEERGHVERRIDRDDLRTFNVVLTEQGRQVAHSMLQDMFTLAERIMSALEDESLESLNSTLRTVLKDNGDADAS